MCCTMTNYGASVDSDKSSSQSNARRQQKQQKIQQNYDVNRKSLPTRFSLYAIFSILLLTMPRSDALEEGDRCSLKTYAGECTPVSKCNDRIGNYISRGLITQDDVVNCGFTPYEEIICCPLELGMRSKEVRPAEQACRTIQAGLNNSLSAHIIGGVPAEPMQYPHMAAIAYNAISGQNPYEFRCGGSLIEKRFVLTAAHCVISPREPPIFVRLGVIDIELPLDENAIDIDVVDVNIHDNYTLNSKYDDIAILTLKSEVVTSPWIYPVCLHFDINDPTNDGGEYYVSGWGVFNLKTKERPHILLKAQLNIVPLASCNDSFSQASGGSNRQFARGLLQTQICAAGFQKDACLGDSGGPLIQVIDDSKRFYSIVGIVSAGFSCSSATPGLYTRVAAYLDYIESVVWPGQ